MKTTLLNTSPKNFAWGGLSGGSGSVAPSFSPTDIAGLKLWLDASQITGLVNDDPVATWTDESGTGNDVTEATNRPLYKTGGLNSNPYVYFDGTNDRMSKSTPVGLPTGTNARTVFIVAECRSLGNYRPMYAYGTSSPNQVFSLAFHSTTQLLSWGHNNDDIITTTLANNTGYYFMHQYTGTNIVVRQNGSQIANYADTIATGSTILGVGNYIDTTFPYYYPSSTNIYEILIYDSSISGADLTNAEAYIADKYGL